MTVTNTSTTKRHWNHLTNKETGTTLELDPGESGEVDDLPDDFEDPYLEVTAGTPAGPLHPPSQPASPAAAPDPAEEQ